MRLRLRRIGVLGLGFLVLLACQALGQTQIVPPPSQVKPPVFLPPASPPEIQIENKPARRAIPKPSKKRRR